MDIYKIYMVIFLLTYFGLVIGVRTALLYKKTKIDALDNFGKKPKIKRAERIIQFALFLMVVIAINFIFISANYKYLIPIEFLEIGWSQTVGFAIGILGLMLTFVAQLQMKDSWRLGIDKNENVELITHGLFSISRNPIYLGLGVSFLGFFFIAPNVISIIFILLMFYGVHEKINDEEEFLLGKFGAEFKAYKLEVRKWI